nr:MAG TPA: hypothetical protein [Caudoviricetes sp.]
MDHCKQTFTDAIAIKALNTIIMYCAAHACRKCILRDDLEKYDLCPVPQMSCKKDFGFFTGDNSETHAHKSPKFDATLSDSPLFRDYINGILKLEADRAGMLTGGLGPVKCYPNGTIKVWYTDDDGETVYKGKAKCHPNDAFNPEIGIKLAVQRIAEKMNKPFIPTDGETYYYVDDKDTVYSTINHNTNRDILNIAVGNCFKNYQRALSNKDTITKRIKKAAELLKKLRDERDEQHETCLRTRLPETWGKVETL